jgi:glycosyltransferase involved in cell wall biosynthesis
MTPRSRTAVFFARVAKREHFEQYEFYAQDIRVLRELGYEVTLAASPMELRPADLYVAWWWSWAFVPVSLARVLRRPIIVTGTFDYWSFPSRPAHQRALMAYSLALATRNVFVSPLEFEEVPRLARVHEPRLVPHAIDTTIYAPGTGPREDVIFTLANMQGDNGTRKCIAEIIRAAALVHVDFPDVRFVVAGIPAPEYLRLAADLGVDRYCSFPGVIGQPEKLALMRACKVYLQPTRFEGFGLAIAEAMSCGAPVVTSRVGAVPHVVGEEARYVRPDDPADIARGVIDLLRDDATRADLAHRGNDRIRTRFSYEQHRAAWARILAEL